jgi:hypothetical protein
MHTDDSERRGAAFDVEGKQKNELLDVLIRLEKRRIVRIEVL